MKEPIRLLLIEDSEEDALFLLRYLKRGGYGIFSERVDTTEDLAAALEGGEWDAVVSDWVLPDFDALDALALVRKKDPDLPFVIVSGAIGEERAVEAMKAGAHDYVAKSNLVRLWAAIEREMDGARGRREKKRAEEALRESEERYRAVVEQSADGIYLLDVVTKRIVETNPSLQEMFGYAAEEFRGMEIYDLIAHSREDVDYNLRRTLAERSRFVGERKYRRNDGTLVDVEVGVSTISYGGKEVVCAVVRDITERKQAEKTLRESEQLFRASFEQAAVGMAHVSLLSRWLRVNDKLCEMLGYGGEEMLLLGFQEVTHPADLDADFEQFSRVLAGKLETFSVEKRYIRKDGRRIWVDQTLSVVRVLSGRIDYFVCVVEEITERKLTELLPEPLSPQEIEVLKLLIQGKTNQQVARELNYSLGTIKLHVRHILAKLEVKSRDEAALRAVEIGLLPP